MSLGHYEIKLAKNGQFYFHLKASNGEIILSSELYTTKGSAENGIASVQKNCRDDSNFDRLLAKGEHPYFVLKAQNHQVIGNSEMYSSESARDHGIESVIKNGVSTDIRDLTK